MPPNLTIHTLGHFTITLKGEPVSSVRSRTAEALLVYLACHKRPLSRQVIADFLWDERPSQQASANLRTIITMLRKELGDYLIVTRQTIAFNHNANYTLDATQFEEQMELLTPQLKTQPNHSSKISSELNHTLTQYKGDFLTGFYLNESRGFEEWALITRERLRRHAADGLRILVHHCLETGQYSTGIQYAERLLSLNNLDEDAHRSMMWLQVRSGEPNAALQQYDACCAILNEELSVLPAAATTRLYEKIRSLTFPPPQNIPPLSTHFVGREKEMAELTHLLTTTETRLITLFGTGGMGKTRLSLKIARHFTQQQPGFFIDGVFYVPLDLVTETDVMIVRIAEMIGFSFHGTEPIQTQLGHHLSEKELLLILDNFEQLLREESTAVDCLAYLLQTAPHLKLFVTSRERLQLYEEQLFDIHGLDVPAQGAAQPETYSAVTLFTAQAQRLNRQFFPTPSDLEAIVQICQLLQGVPLAIELAAGWIREHSCTDIVQRIQASLDFLRTTVRNVPSRQRSLSAVFEHSWALLTPTEQAVFCQLSIFEESFAANAANTIVELNLPGIVQKTIDDCVESLLYKSLLQDFDNGRYQIHPLLRDYAAEKLNLTPDTAVDIITQHTHFFMKLLAQQEDGSTPDERVIIAADIPNIRRAWQHAAQTGNFTLLDQGAGALHGFYSVQSWFHEGIAAFQYALDHLETTQSPTTDQAPVLCELHRRKARMQIHIGQIEQARQTLQQSVHYLQSIESDERQAAVLGNLAITHFYAGDYEQAADLAQTSLHLSEKTNDTDGVAFGYNFLGSCAKALGNYDQARNNFENAVTTYRQLDDEIGMAMVLNNLGNLAQAANKYEDAAHYYRQCSDLFKAHNHIHGAATALANAGRLALRQEAYDDAQLLLTESLSLKTKLNDQRGIAVALAGLGDVSLATRAYAVAEKQAKEALSLSHASGDTKLSLEVLVLLAAIELNRENVEQAQRLLAFVVAQKATAYEARDRATMLMEKVQGMETAVPLFQTWASTQTIDGITASILS
jgi:predicted ATPase/DNA-binding SARP family transcriptional activator